MLFVFEGVDGVGKSTVIRNVEALLREKRFPVVVLSDPSKEFDTTLAIRKELFSRKYPQKEATALFVAARYILEAKIKDLGPEVIVLLDRYWPSTAIYQFNGVEGNAKACLDLLEDSMQVDGYFFLVDSEVAIASRLNGRDDKNHYDATTLSAIKDRQDKYSALFSMIRMVKPSIFVVTINMRERPVDLISGSISTIAARLRRIT